jgi:methylmalonyl-CoA mutase
LRLKTEEFDGKKPTVYLLTYGNLAQRKTRAIFSLNFFACAGFNIIEGQGFPALSKCIRDCLNYNPQIVVICSSDEEYQQIVPEIYPSLKDKTIIVIAGFPEKLVNEFSKIGIKYFIHKGSNVLETLKNFQKDLGII